MNSSKFSGFFAAFAAIAAITSVSAALYTTGAKAAGETRGGNIAFVDFRVIMQESDVGKSINSQVAAKQQAMQDQAQEKLKQFKAEQDAINKQKASLSPAEFEEKGKALQGKINDWNAYVQQQQGILNNAAGIAIRNVQDVLRDQLAALAEQNNYSTVLSTEAAFYIPKKSDVTAEAIRRLNAQLPKVEVKLEDKAAAPAAKEKK